MSSEAIRGRLVRGAGQTGVCPARHTLTEACALVNGKTVGASKIELYLVEIHPGGEGQEDSHPGREHGFFVLAGEGEAYVEGEHFALQPEDSLFIPPGARHSVRPTGAQPLRMVVFIAPHR